MTMADIADEDAADIEKLRTENAEMRLALEAPTKFELELRDEIERLRAALQDIDRHAVVYRRVDPYDALQTIERMVQRALTGREDER